MKKNLSNLYYLFACLLKLLLSLIIMNYALAIVYTIVTGTLYFIVTRNFKLAKFIPAVILDVLLCLMFINDFIATKNSIASGVVYFLIFNTFTYGVLIVDVANRTSIAKVKTSYNDKIDLGIKALDNNNLDEATYYFSVAIKEHKTGYLGYMGMCNTLNKMSERDIRKFKKYKSKCLKYAPKELRDNIKERLN